MDPLKEKLKAKHQLWISREVVKGKGVDLHVKFLEKFEWNIFSRVCRHSENTLIIKQEWKEQGY